MNLADIQQELRNQKLDGWLFFDHHLRDPLAYRILGLTPGKGPSRRWYYMIPAEGEPKGMEHRIERNQLAGLPGEKIAYSSWTEQVAALGKLTAGMKRVAMAYSPMCAVPYVAIVDAGTVELVRSLGVEVVTAAELIQIFEARWTPAALETPSGSRAPGGQGPRRGLRTDSRAHAQRRAARRRWRSRTSCGRASPTRAC